MYTMWEIAYFDGQIGTQGQMNLCNSAMVIEACAVFES